MCACMCVCVCVCAYAYVCVHRCVKGEAGGGDESACGTKNTTWCWSA